jgi:hypothetical protein
VRRQTAPGRGKSKSRQCGGLSPYIPIFGHEVNENVGHNGPDEATDWPRFSRSPQGKLGKTEKTESGCRADSCHGVSR